MMRGGGQEMRLAPDPFQEAEDALRVLRQTPDNAASRQRAAATLEWVLKAWRQDKAKGAAPEGGGSLPK
jgi:hypothetical protein